MRLIPAIGIVLAATVLAACGDKSPPPDAAAAAPRLVKAHKVSLGDTPGERRYSGEVRARHESVLGFRVGGKLTERLVDAGARVRAGQPLARLDPADARLSAAQAEANAALAAADFKRAQELRAKNFVSQAALDARESAARAAEAQAQLTRNQAAYTTLAADATGVIAAVLAEPSQVVAAGQGVVRLARDGEREVAIAIPESELPSVKVGGNATVSLWASDKTYQGRIREVAPAADPATRTFAVRVSILGVEPTAPLGMTGTVGLARREGERPRIPLAAVFQQDGKPAVWIIGDDQALRLRAIEVERYDNDFALLKGGLADGETIVAAGAYKLAAGEKVRVVP
jgi:RND family efflux transporter MFP subunit